MIIEEIQGNIANLSQDEKQKHVEKVYLENSDLVKRIQRVKTDHGNEIGYVLNNLLIYSMVISYIKTIKT